MVAAAHPACRRFDVTAPMPPDGGTPSPLPPSPPPASGGIPSTGGIPNVGPEAPEAISYPDQKETGSRWCCCCGGGE